jgi:prophage regulatory protein
MLAQNEQRGLLGHKETLFDTKEGGIMERNQTVQNAGFLRLPDVLKLFPVSKSTWWNGIKEKKYPPPIRLSRRCVAWRTVDIQKLIEGMQ